MSQPAFVCQPVLRSNKNRKNTVFCFYFQTFVSDLRCEITEKGLKRRKRLKTAKKRFWPAFMCVQDPKAVQNTQHLPNLT